MQSKQAVFAACEKLGVIGPDVREHLEAEVPTKVILRRARDVVLISGPTGSGKEVSASVCHEAAYQALGRAGAMVPVNCANLRGGLFESELFGHRRGAFTGAERDFGGLLEQAAGGTLLLDEVQSLEASDQAKLLRFLGEREYRRVGDNRPRTSDALIILASNDDLRARAAEGDFRRDLLDRATAKITLPSLYQRRRDIGQLAQFFALEAGEDAGIEEFMGLTRRARAEIEAAIVQAREVSVRRLREIVRDAVFVAAAADHTSAGALESDAIRPFLVREFAFDDQTFEAQDQQELQSEFALLVARQQLESIATRHAVSLPTVERWCDALHQLLQDMEGSSRSYRDVVYRVQRMNKVALWLVSGAQSQAEFRRFFGTLDAEKPTKSVAHQVYYDVFPRSDGEPQ